MKNLLRTITIVLSMATGAWAQITVTAISPPEKEAGEGDFELTIKGTNFAAGTKAQWNGEDLTTQFVGATELRAKVPAARIVNPNSAVTIRVVPPSGNSQEGNFRVVRTTPTQDDTLRGLGFGIALSLNWNFSGRDRITEAVIDEAGFVRVTKRINTDPRMMFELHHFFFRGFCKGTNNSQKCGTGLFVAVQPGNDAIITRVGAGFMTGWKKPGEGNKSFNIGIGYSSDPSVKVLGSGFKEDQLAPTDANGNVIPIRYQERDKGGLLFIASFAFN